MACRSTGYITRDYNPNTKQLKIVWTIPSFPKVRVEAVSTTSESFVGHNGKWRLWLNIVGDGIKVNLESLSSEEMKVDFELTEVGMMENVDINYAIKMLVEATKYDIIDLIAYSEDYIIEHLTNESAFDLIDPLHNVNSPKVKEAARLHIIANKIIISQTPNLSEKFWKFFDVKEK